MSFNVTGGISRRNGLTTCSAPTTIDELNIVVFKVLVWCQVPDRILKYQLVIIEIKSFGFQNLKKEVTINKLVVIIS
jgi:hypothetical protein